MSERYRDMKAFEASLADEKELRYVGWSSPNRESAAKVTGEAVFVDDMRFPGMLHAALLLSPHAHARIVSIDAQEAEQLPGVRAVVHTFNSPRHRFNTALRYYGDNSPVDMPETETIFDDTVHFVGDRVAAVAADSAEIARQAVKLIRVVYEPLPAVLDELEALKPGAPQANLYGLEGGNVCGGRLAYGSHSEAEVLAALDAADLVFEDTFRTSKVHHGYLEPVCHLATYSREGKLTVYTPTQNVFGFQVVVAQALGLPHSKVRIVKGLIGGAFGGKLEVLHEPVAALLAMRTRRPVKLRLDRAEVFISTRSRHPATLTVTTGVSRDGALQAQIVRSVLNTGGYAGAGPNTVGAQSGKTFILYAVPRMFYDGVSVYTNTPPAGAMRGYGCPQIMLARETQIDRICRALGCDPVQFRLDNVLQPYQKTCMGNDIHNARIADCIRTGAAAFDWTRRRRQAEATHDSRLRRGVGIALAVHGNGWFPVYQDVSTVTLRLHNDGTAVLLTGAHDLGTGARTVLAQIAGEVLTIHPDRIEVVEADTDVTPLDLGAQASRTTYVAGNATVMAARNLRGQILAEAAGALKLPSGELDLLDSCIVTRDGGRCLMTIADVVASAQRGSAGGAQRDLVATESFESLESIDSYVADFCEVEADAETGRVKVVDFLAVHNSGRVVNPLLFEGQVHGGIQMGLGYALSEEMIIDEATGAMKNAHFKKYRMFKAADMPPVRVLTVQDPEVAGPFGAKSIGECATDAVAPCVVNAVNHALGVEIRQVPLTPVRVLAALRQKSPALA